jgi:glyoxylase-like metal-dependent hydrolase (beta-lactamase superfamily II)
MFTGDHVLGRGSTVIEWPGGDMRAYLDSLEAVRRFGAERLYPGHGPLVTDPAATLREYTDHRLQREAQVLAALAAGDRTAAQIVARVYADVDPVLHPAAELSVRAHLVKLVRDGKVRELEDGEAFVPAG